MFLNKSYRQMNRVHLTRLVILRLFTLWSLVRLLLRVKLCISTKLEHPFRPFAMVEGHTKQSCERARTGAKCRAVSFRKNVLFEPSCFQARALTAKLTNEAKTFQGILIYTALSGFCFSIYFIPVTSCFHLLLPALLEVI